MNLVKYNNPILLTECKKVDFSDPPFDVIEYAKELVKFMYDNNGIGLASNQVDVPYSIFAMRGQPENFVCVNPRIVDTSEEQILLEEGCLSYPELVVKIKRPRHIKLRFNTPNGDTRTEKFTGMTARIVQHEIKHLEGKPFWEGISRYHFEKGMKKSKIKVPLNG